MLNDLFLIETYFGPVESAQIEEKLIRRYGSEAIHNALSKGYLTKRELFAGPLRGKVLYWLSDKGRRAASIAKAA